MKNNYAFIDSQNVNLAIRDQGWKIDWNRLYKHLIKMYNCSRVYIFIWYIAKNQRLYTRLQQIWFILIFKPVLELSSWQTKWNVDAELVLETIIEFNNFDKAIIITWDWDFACLVRHLKSKWKLRKLIVPNINKYSRFLKVEAEELLDSLTNKRQKLEYK